MPSGTLVLTRHATIENEVDDDASHDQHGAYESEAARGFAKGEKRPGRGEDELGHADHVRAERGNAHDAASVKDICEARADAALSHHERDVSAGSGDGLWHRRENEDTHNRKADEARR